MDVGAATEVAAETAADIVAVYTVLRQENEEGPEEEDATYEALDSTQRRLDNMLHNEESRGAQGNATRPPPLARSGRGGRSGGRGTGTCRSLGPHMVSHAAARRRRAGKCSRAAGAFRSQRVPRSRPGPTGRQVLSR